MKLDEYLAQPPKLELHRKLRVVAWIASALVLGLVAMMRQIKFSLPEGVELDFLPLVHAILNSTVAALLVVAVIAIKNRNVTLHKRAIAGAMICSIAFLGCYVIYHFTHAETKFGGEGWIRIAYYVLLISHIVLAAVSFPFILFTWIYAYTNQFSKHRRMVKWVFPMWLYVAVTGPICYLMLRPYY